MVQVWPRRLLSVCAGVWVHKVPAPCFCVYMAGIVSSVVAGRTSRNIFHGVRQNQKLNTRCVDGTAPSLTPRTIHESLTTGLIVVFPLASGPSD